jgi:glycine hydroxymethyltransferase
MTDLSPDFFNRPLIEVDPEIADVLQRELERQQRTLEMIASENFVPQAILECQGSVLTNKYAEGYPGKRYYGGCEFVDIAEQLAIDRAKAIFGAEHVNVQPHAGAQANASVYHALLQPGDTIMGLALPHGGHLTHGMKINVSGRLYDIAPYEVDRETSLIDMDVLERIAHERRPKLILAGWSAYPRFLDFERFRAIADAVGAYLVVDMAHFAGLVAAGEHPNPVPYADVVTSTVHKTLGGARGGVILCREEHAKAINSAVFPGQQGGPLEHIIAGKAVAFKIAQTELFRERQRRTVAGAKALAEELLGAGHGVNVLTGGTDVHLVLVDLRESELDGQMAEDRLHEIGITVNRNAVPFDPRPPMVTSGLRVGTPALATRGLQVEDFHEVGRIIATALSPEFERQRPELGERVTRARRGIAQPPGAVGSAADDQGRCGLCLPGRLRRHRAADAADGSARPPRRGGRHAQGARTRRRLDAAARRAGDARRRARGLRAVPELRRRDRAPARGDPRRRGGHRAGRGDRRPLRPPARHQARRPGRGRQHPGRRRGGGHEHHAALHRGGQLRQRRRPDHRRRPGRRDEHRQLLGRHRRAGGGRLRDQRHHVRDHRL